ncbi:MAG: ribbon-helix-helix protein, CopG family [Nitrospinae bacterium]|nr:ribbon-helix-helix protein, CopG family [Nitrospinota bacterium]
MEQQVAVRMPDDMVKRLDKLARKTGRGKSYYIREAVSEFLDDLADGHIALKRMNSKDVGKRA